MDWARRHPRLFMTLAALLIFLAALFIYPAIYCAAFFEIALLPSVVSYNGIMKLGNPKEVDDLLSLLEGKHEDAVAHEGAHRNAYGEWSGKTYYYYYRAKNRNYALAGCTPFRLGAPLEVLHGSALAPAELTEADRFVARFVQSAIFFFDFRFADAEIELANALTGLIKYLWLPVTLLGSLIACLYLLVRSFW